VTPMYIVIWAAAQAVHAPVAAPSAPTVPPGVAAGPYWIQNARARVEIVGGGGLSPTNTLRYLRWDAAARQWRLCLSGHPCGSGFGRVEILRPGPARNVRTWTEQGTTRLTYRVGGTVAGQGPVWLDIAVDLLADSGFMRVACKAASHKKMGLFFVLRMSEPCRYLLGDRALTPVLRDRVRTNPLFGWQTFDATAGLRPHFVRTSGPRYMVTADPRHAHVYALFNPGGKLGRPVRMAWSSGRRFVQFTHMDAPFVAWGGSLAHAGQFDMVHHWVTGLWTRLRRLATPPSAGRTTSGQGA